MSAQVSVVVPVKNRRDLLAALLDSLHRQTLRAHEVLVVDDGSTDGAFDVATRAASQDERIRVIQNPGAGAVAARLAGVAASTAPHLAFVDSDCVADARWLEHGVAALEAGADVAQGRTLPARDVRPAERSVSVAEFDGLYATCNIFYRRGAYDAAGGFDPSAAGRLGFRSTAALRGLGFGEDALLGWRVARRGVTAFVEDAVVRHHVFPPNVRESLRRAWLAGAFPALVREIPELRRTFLTHSVFVGDPGRSPLYAAALCLMRGRRRHAAVLSAGWFAWRALGVAESEPGRRRWPLATAHVCAADAVTGAALVVGSVRARTLVL